jgi:fusion and transport protein UGO1
MLTDDPDITNGNGVWSTMRRLRYTPSEGWPSLLKSQLISTFHSIFSNFLQPHVHSILLLIVPSSPSTPSLSLGLGTPDLPLTALQHPTIPLGLQVASHLISHLVLSPLELLRTRLIVMPHSHPSTPNSISLLRQIVNTEGGFSSLYLHSNLLFPAVLEHTLRPLLTLSIPLLLERQFNISPDLSPITYSLCDLSLGLGSLLILLPIETVRKRLQLQSRAVSVTAAGIGSKSKSTGDMKSIVRLKETPYVGIVDAMWRIVNEETGVRRKRNMTEKDEGGVLSGIRQLYRGVSDRVLAVKKKRYPLCGLGSGVPAIWPLAPSASVYTSSVCWKLSYHQTTS